MALLVPPLIRRHMRHAASFVAYEAGRPLPFSWSVGGETLVGWYDNPPPWAAARVVFTNKAIYTASNGEVAIRIPLDDITDYQLPESKEEAAGVRIITGDGIRFVRMAGRSGPGHRYPDAFALVGFLHAYLGATRREQGRR